MLMGWGGVEYVVLCNYPVTVPKRNQVRRQGVGVANGGAVLGRQGWH